MLNTPFKTPFLLLQEAQCRHYAKSLMYINNCPGRSCLNHNADAVAVLICHVEAIKILVGAEPGTRKL